ncbi:MAG TPA: DoxX family protein [Pseudonocardiaceae bacterium]|nr:DoxX family protein [Pseudonocardiaceae bacterium]
MDSALVRGRHGQSGLFAVGVGVVESVIAICLVLGAFSRPVLLGAAVFSFGIWSAAEGFHLPWSKPGITDLGPSVGYVVASLARYLAAAGATWSVDNRLRPRMGKPAWLCSPRRTNLARSS